MLLPFKIVVKVMSLSRKFKISYRKSDTGKDEFGLRAPVTTVVFVMVFNWIFYEKQIKSQSVFQPACLTVCLPTCLPTGLSAYRPVCLPARLPTGLTDC
jgi:hypothetical protein